MGDGQELPEDYPKKPQLLCSGKEPFTVEEPKKLKTLRRLDREYYKLGFRVMDKAISEVHNQCKVCGRYSCRREDHVSM